MSAPTITLAALAKLGPCEDVLADVLKALPKRRRITAAVAREAGISFDDIVWVAFAVAQTNKDVERRLRLWLADCAVHVLHIYEKTETSDAPREAIIAARRYARGEIDSAAWAAARASEEAWQFDRLIAWLSDEEPADLALLERAAKAA